MCFELLNNLKKMLIWLFAFNFTLLNWKQLCKLIIHSLTYLNIFLLCPIYSPPLSPYSAGTQSPPPSPQSPGNCSPQTSRAHWEAVLKHEPRGSNAVLSSFHSLLNKNLVCSTSPYIANNSSVPLQMPRANWNRFGHRRVNCTHITEQHALHSTCCCSMKSLETQCTQNFIIWTTGIAWIFISGNCNTIKNESNLNILCSA